MTDCTNFRKFADPTFEQEFPNPIRLAAYGLFEDTLAVSIYLNSGDIYAKRLIANAVFKEFPFDTVATGVRYIRELRDGVIVSRRAELLCTPNAATIEATEIKPYNEELETLLLKHGPALNEIISLMLDTDG